jgi:hypothetical protein
MCLASAQSDALSTELCICNLAGLLRVAGSARIVWQPLLSVERGAPLPPLLSAAPSPIDCCIVGSDATWGLAELFSFRCSCTIDVPPEKAFALLCSTARRKEWDLQFREWRPVRELDENNALLRAHRIDSASVMCSRSRAHHVSLALPRSARSSSSSSSTTTTTTTTITPHHPTTTTHPPRHIVFEPLHDDKPHDYVLVNSWRQEVDGSYVLASRSVQLDSVPEQPEYHRGTVLPSGWFTYRT